MDMRIAMIFEAIDNASSKMDAMMQATDQFGRNQVSAAREQIQHHKEARHALAAEAVEIAGLGYGLLTLTNAAGDFESRMAGVNKVTQFNDQETAIAALGERILSLSNDIPMTASEIATLIESAGQAGLIDSGLSDEKQLAAYTRYAELSGQIGTAFDISAQQAGDTATLWMKTWGLAEDQVIDLADATNHLSNNLSASAPQILDILQRQGGFVRATTGMAEAEIAALSASFAAASPNAEIAATSMKNFVSAMTEGAAAPKAQIEAFQALGFSATDLAERMQTDAKGAILDVFAAIEDAPDELRSSLLTKAFGQESIGAIATLAANTDALAYSFELIEDPADRVNSFLEEYLVQAGTTVAQQDRFLNGMKELQITIGTALIPILIELMAAVSPVLREFTAWVQANPELLAQIAKLAVGLMAAKAATIPLRYGWHLLMGGLAHGRLAFGLITASLGIFGRVSSLAMRAATFGARIYTMALRGLIMPIRWAIVTFGQKLIATRLVTGAAGLYKMAIQRMALAIRAVVLGAGRYVVAMGRKVMATRAAALAGRVFVIAMRGMALAVRALSLVMAASPIGLIIAALAAAVYLIYRNWDGVVTFFKRLWQNVTDVVQGVWDFFAGLFTGDTERMIGGLGQVWDGVTGLLTAPFEAAWNTVEAIFAEFGIQFEWSPMDIIRAAWSGVSDFVDGLFGGIGDTISNTWDKVSGFFNWWGDKDEEVARAEAIADLPKKLDATNPQSMITAAEASEQLAKNVAAIEGANLRGLSTEAKALASEISGVKGAVLHSLDEMDAALEATDYSYHGSRLMETLAAGILAGKHFVTGAISSVLAETREYLPSSPAKRGPLSDIHRLKFMETIAGSINPAPLLDAIGNATGLARGAMDMVSQPIAIGGAGSNPVMAGANGFAVSGDTFSAKFENHYHGNVDEAVVKSGNDDLIKQLESWWKKKQDEKNRRGY